MKKFVLMISTTLAIAYSAYAQTDGQYMGSTSQGYPIQFMVTGGGTCVTQFYYSVALGCPSGATSYSGAGYVSCLPIQPDESFSWELPPFDGGPVTFVAAGSFVAPDAAGGTIDFQAAAFRVGEVLDTQICDSNNPNPVTWSAALSTGPAEPLKFDGNQVVTSVDRKTGNPWSLVSLGAKF